MKNAKLEHTLSYWMAHANTKILELENRCTGNRTVGSNPTLSAIFLLNSPKPKAPTHSAFDVR